MAMKARLNEHIWDAVTDIAESERIVLDTGDGVAICFLGDPEDALFVTTAVMAGVRGETGEARQSLRVGINLGPIKLITDLNGHPNVVGDGINVAQRIMSFASDGEILVSRSSPVSGKAMKNCSCTWVRKKTNTFANIRSTP
jgi:hypothetical protein